MIRLILSFILNKFTLKIKTKSASMITRLTIPNVCMPNSTGDKLGRCSFQSGKTSSCLTDARAQSW